MALRPSLRCVIDKEGSMENPGNLTSSKSACYKQGGLCFLFFFICFPYFLFWISSNRQKSCRKSMMNSCKSGLSKLQPAACFGTTRELRRDFIFLSGWKKIKRSCHNTWKWQDSQTRVPQWRDVCLVLAHYLCPVRSTMAELSSCHRDPGSQSPEYVPCDPSLTPDLRSSIDTILLTLFSLTLAETRRYCISLNTSPLDALASVSLSLAQSWESQV